MTVLRKRYQTIIRNGWIGFCKNTTGIPELQIFLIKVHTMMKRNFIWKDFFFEKSIISCSFPLATLLKRKSTHYLVELVFLRFYLYKNV